jgi:hypothetical protein
MLEARRSTLSNDYECYKMSSISVQTCAYRLDVTRPLQYRSWIMVNINLSEGSVRQLSISPTSTYLASLMLRPNRSAERGRKLAALTLKPLPLHRTPGRINEFIPSLSSSEQPSPP